MVNTRGKIKKAQNMRKICFSHASTEDSSYQSTRSRALIGSNDDLLIKILLWLPVTSILRFKSVSKHWKWLLSHSRFTLLYDNLSKSPGLFVRNIYIPFDAANQSTPPFRSLDFYFDPCGIKIIQSCNGLLLCCSDRNKRARKYYVFNPTTKQFSIIPSVRGGRNVRRTIRFMGLAFHQTDCVHYKLVCIRGVEPMGELCEIQIYSSEIGKWKISSESFSANCSFRCGVYWNGAIHWAPSCHNPLYFKIAGEQLQTLALPPNVASFGGFHRGATPLYFGESRGHLHLVDTANGENHLHLIVYEMMSDCSGWFVKFQVELDDLPGAFPEMINSYLYPSSPYCYQFNVFDVVRGENEEDTFMVVRIPGKLIRYNVRDKSFKQIFNLTIYFSFPESHSNVHRYTETLTSF
ncbi:putative F-box domain-containing protein [Helianthus annuus]|nr:putative F-box domain-containing protein [Helianthus annuus]